MNKVLNIIKYLLFALAVALILYFIKEYRLLKKDEVTSFNFTFIFMLSLLGLIFILNIIDLIKIKKVNKLKGYNILSIIDLLIVIFIFARTLFDNTIISNPLRSLFYGYYNSYGFKYCMFYCKIINILLILNIMYFIINVKKFKNKKH